MSQRFKKRLKPKTASNQTVVHMQAKFQQALTLHQQGQLIQAQILYEEILKMQPNHFDALHLLGVIALQTGNPKKAVELIGKAIAINPRNAVSYYNHGTACKELRQFEAALASFDQAIAVNPAFGDAHYNRGAVLMELKQFEAALASYDQVIALKPDSADAHNIRGAVLQELKQFEAALAGYDQAIALEPGYVVAHYNRGNVLQELKRYQAAIESYDKALAIKSDYNFLRGQRLHTQMLICDWNDAENQLTELMQKIQRNEKVASPFSVLALSSSLPLQRKAAEIWVREKYPANSGLGNIAKRFRGEKIRLGYFSMDFRIHPVSFLTAELFEIHDRNRFEVIAFSFGPDTQDEMRQRLEGAFDRFIDVSSKSDKEIAELARLLEIDIAIDLAGHTADARTGIFAMRAAPIQVNFLGYPGTMNADYMDYLIADKQLIPEEAKGHYAEKIAYLPCFQPNDSKRKISDKVFTREELGLPESGFVFCSFNNSYKITPDTFAGWMRILKRVEGSVLWLSAGNPSAADNLRKEAVQRGVEAQRLVFAQRMPLLAEHLARHRAADLFIDTLPYNAHTTASDALWAGLPVLTCTGEAFAGRVAASLLTAIELPELITGTQEGYEDLAVALAADPERLKAIRQKLAHNRLTTPLFDTRLFTKNIEDAYMGMYERYQADLPPDHICIQRV